MTVTATPERSKTTKLEAADFVAEQFAALRLPVPHRFAEMRRVLGRGYVESKDPEFRIALETQRDINHLWFSFLRAHEYGCMTDPTFRKLLQHVANDRPLPQDDGADTPGRNAQLELYLAAICQNGGLTPVAYEEPDVTCTIGGFKFGIAAKRIKSASQVEKRISKAARQIEDTGLPGVIVLDVTVLRNPRNEPIVSRMHSQMYECIAYQKNTQFFKQHAALIADCAADTGTFAVLAVEFTHRLRPDDTWHHEEMIFWHSTVAADSEADRRFRIFRRGLKSGMPHRVDLDEED